MALVGTDLRYTRVNRALSEMLGYGEEELCGLSVHDIAPADEVEKSLEHLRQMLGGESESFSREKRLLHRDGSIVWAQLSGAPVRGPGREVRFFVNQIQNITGAKAVAQELRESQALHRLVVENARDLIAVIGLDGRIRLVSASVEPSLGWRREELIGRPFAEFLHPDEIRAVQASIVATLERNESNPMRVRILHRDGSWRVFETAGAAAYDDAGRPDFLVVTGKDVTEREELEAQLRQAQKLEAIGKLAGGVAHDFNNLLTAINGYSDVALGVLEDTDSRARHAVEEIRRAGERAAELTQQLLAFGRRQTLRPKVVSVNEIVEDCAGLLHRVLGEDIVLRTRLEPAVANVLADPGQLSQVLMNLAVNARDAMPAGGELRIETANEGPFVRVDVVDDGDGMDAETRARAFDPFFTTKELGSGTGLGLATVLGIVQQSGGRIEAISEPGEGATFSVFLPATEERATSSPAPRDTEPVEVTGRILVVEDDHIVRGLVAETLEDAGFEVVEAALPSVALELVENGELDLLLTDIVMPEMNGRELARRILELRPGLRVLYTSGYAADVVSERGALDEGDAFIQKPYPTSALVEAVRELLAGQPRPKSELSSAKKSASPA
jgi:PAS domain S-box-containing protein